MTSNTAPSRAFLIPAYNPGELLYEVVRGLRREISAARLKTPIVVVDDGCTDGTFREEALREHLSGVVILSHNSNQGKGAALRSGLTWAAQHQVDEVLALDADGQHPPKEALRLLLQKTPPGQLVLGIRDLRSAGAPLANQRSNAFSNLMLSWMCGERLLDTQCGLRRYPTLPALALNTPANGYAFESDLLLRAARQGVPIVQISCTVLYPKEHNRVSYFDSVKDPARIIFEVLRTTLTVPHHRVLRRYFRRIALLGLASALLLGVFCSHPA